MNYNLDGLNIIIFMKEVYLNLQLPENINVPKCN